MTVRAWAHLHTRVSRDADLDYGALRAAAASRGVRVLLLTEHQEALRPGEAEAAARRCREISDDLVLLVPGLEISSRERYHVLGFGLAREVESAPAVELAGRIRENGGYPVLAHPARYRAGWEEVLPGIGAVEVWNRHYDGRFSPSRAALSAWRAAAGVRALFGLDAHGEEALSGALPELLIEVGEVTEEAVVSALRDGSFATGRAGRPVAPDETRDRVGEAYRRLRAAARRIGYALPVSERTRLKWGRRL